MEAFENHFKGLIRQFGPMDIGHFMQLAVAQYYATRDPFGSAGDFTTAPEISQIFGELIGLCLADAWLRSGKPQAHVVELGPGRGTLMADILRATRRVPGFERMGVQLVEASPTLRDKQRALLADYPHTVWHDDISTLPEDGPLMIVANEFFDALPIRQAVMTQKGWQERVVGLNDAGELVFGATALPPVFAPQRPVEIGAIVEFSPLRDEIFGALCKRIQTQGGIMLVIDYGYDTPNANGDTLQAMYKHAHCPILSCIGEADITSHVDFAQLKVLATKAGCRVAGSVTQGHFLNVLGIRTRLAQLEAKNPGTDLRSGVERLTDPAQMGSLFRVLSVSGDLFSPPAGL